MAFISLRTASFRNLQNDEINIKGKDIFLIGENGQGKTNFIEALYYASYGSSFRGVRDNELVRTGENDCLVSVKLENPLNTILTVAYKNGKKNISLDNKRIEDRKELLVITPCIVFCHEDMEFVAGSPERRRWFFDQTQSLWDSLYLDDLRNFRKILKIRNNLLKKNSSESSALLDALDPQFVQYGYELMKKRRIEAEEFSKVLEPLYREISGLDGISVSYSPSWKEDNAEAIMTGLFSRRETDFTMGLSFSGPHRDRYIFTRKGREFSGKASTGQRRLLALLLRISQAKIFSEKTGNAPVLLLDDVLLELDGGKRRKFLSLMPEYEQAFYTFLPDEPYDLYRKDDTIVYKVSNGILTWKT